MFDKKPNPTKYVRSKNHQPWIPEYTTILTFVRWRLYFQVLDWAMFNRKLLYHEGTAPYISSKIIERLNLKITQENKKLSKINNKKNIKTAPVNAIQMSL